MRKIQLTEPERRVRAIDYSTISRIFINGENIGHNIKRKGTSTTATLPLDKNGTILEPAKSAPIMVKLLKVDDGNISARIIKGKDELPDNKLPLPFRLALRRINKEISDANFEAMFGSSEFDTISTDELDKLEALDPEKIFQRQPK